MNILAFYRTLSAHVAAHQIAVDALSDATRDASVSAESADEVRAALVAVLKVRA